MESKKQIKYARQIQKDLAELFQKDTNHYFKSALGTIVHVSVSSNLRLARVYFSIFPIEASNEIFQHLKDTKSEIKFKLGKKIGNRVNNIPDLVFFLDDTMEKAFKIDRLIDNLNIPTQEK